MPGPSYTSISGPHPDELAAGGDGASSGAAGFSPVQILHILRAYWRVSVAVAGVIVLLSAVAAKLLPRSFVSTATLMVSTQTADPLAEKDFELGMFGSYVATQMELMQSSDVLDGVIARLHLDQIPEFSAGNRGGDATLRDWVEAKLRRDLDIEQGRSGSQLIYISASASNAGMAADIANAVADVYTEQLGNRDSIPAGERTQRYSAELADLKKKVETAQSAVTEFRARNGAVDLDAKANVDMDLLNSLEHRLLDARNALRSNEARASGRQDVSAPVLASTSVSGLQGELAKLNARMAQLRTELGPNHPQVIQLQSEIDANKASLDAALSTYSRAANSDVSVSSHEVDALDHAVRAQREKVLQNQRVRDEAAKYELELESAQSVYKKALDGFDQAKFASSGNPSKISIASRARPPIKAVKPNPLKILALGIVLAMGAALAVPFALELPRRRIRCAADLEKSFGLPVLAELPASTPLPGAFAAPRAAP